MLKLDQTWTVFLDRDGVINERIFGGYVRNTDEFRFLPGAPEAIAAISRKAAHVFVVTNQQGIGKGLMSERNLFDVHDYMCEAVKKRGGVIRSCYFAPGLADPGNMLRKPNPGMALLARQEFPDVDFSKSVMIGDSDSDIVFGRNLGMTTVRVLTAEPARERADYSVSSLKEFAEQFLT